MSNMFNSRFVKGKVLQVFVILTVLVFSTINVFGLQGVWHYPYERGMNSDTYKGDSNNPVVTDAVRNPAIPIAGQPVYVYVTTWPIEAGQSVWITWTKNGTAQTTITAAWSVNSDSNSYWTANLGTFARGDTVTYTVHAKVNGTNEYTQGPFTFYVAAWDYATKTSSYTISNNCAQFSLETYLGNAKTTPIVSIGFKTDEVYRLQLSPNGKGPFTAGTVTPTVNDMSTYYKVSTTGLCLRVYKNPFKIEVYKTDNTTLITSEYDSSVYKNLSWLSDGNNAIYDYEDHFSTPSSEQFYGYGERYESFNMRGYLFSMYVYNEYKDQARTERSYMCIPFFVSSKGYGIYVNTTYRTEFDMANTKPDRFRFTVYGDNAGAASPVFDYYFVYGADIKDVINNYTDITAKSTLMPKWTYGVWMSANEWNTQTELTGVVDKAKEYGIPATGIVLEQWADESTFYIFSGAQYTPKEHGGTFNYSDFTFTGNWTNPRSAVKYVHDNGMKFVLWALPLMKYENPVQQATYDQAYSTAQGYNVKDPTTSDGQYRIPIGSGWFDNSLLLDFTNTNATNWFMSQRNYLTTPYASGGVGIDGFKCDGGEMVWGTQSTVFSTGKKGDEMRNAYPSLYIKSYTDKVRSANSLGATFNRSGSSGGSMMPAQAAAGLYWAGDQISDFDAFQQAMRAGLSAGIAGVSNWGWDLAGFSGDHNNGYGGLPSGELYKRSVEMAAFCPVMQFHSEWNGSDTSQGYPYSQERSPWNIQAHDPQVGTMTYTDHFARYANIRMNLLPYIYSEAKKATTSGAPLMRAMVVEFPEPNTYGMYDQYMFGDKLLVAPVIVAGQTTKSIYLPSNTEWIDFFYGVRVSGGQTISYSADVDQLPVYARSGAIIPMNLNSNYELGGTIGNNLDAYTNLTFRIYPDGNTSYLWYDDLYSGKQQTITSSADFTTANTDTIVLPPVQGATTVQVYCTKPTSVTNNGSSLVEYKTLSGLAAASDGWYYDQNAKLVYAKVVKNTSGNSKIVLSGVGKASLSAPIQFKAEDADLNGVTVNSEIPGDTGDGFVASLDNAGDYIKFNVFTRTSGVYNLNIRYANGGYEANDMAVVKGISLNHRYI